MKYEFIAKEAKHYPTRLLLRTLRVKKSAYYDWRKSTAKLISPEECRLRQRMKALFEASKQSLGSRSLKQQLQREGFNIGRWRVRKLMKALGLVVKLKRRFRVTTDSQHSLPVAENVLNREFNPPAPNRVWAGDITYVWTIEGWLYLAVILDLYSRRVVGWCLDKRMTKSLVSRALMMATNLRNPEPGLIHHSDRGSQYASDEYQKILQCYGMTPSMSRKGNCWDNAPVERFFSSLKREWIGDQLYRTRSEAMADIREYIMVYYNTRRLHSSNGYVTPVEYENEFKNVSGFC